jgi:Domain of unknown function (DUF4136)
MHQTFRLCGRLLLATLPALLSAQKVTVEFDQAMEFASLKTFTLQNGQIHSKNSSLNNDIVRKNLETNIRKRLTQKGLTEVTSQPDLRVSYALGSAGRTQVERYPPRWGGWGARRVAVHYTEGTLTIDLRDPHRQELIWRAIAVVDNQDPNKVQAKLDDMVRKSFDKYPPKKK